MCYVMFIDSRLISTQFFFFFYLKNSFPYFCNLNFTFLLFLYDVDILAIFVCYCMNLIVIKICNVSINANSGYINIYFHTPKKILQIILHNVSYQIVWGHESVMSFSFIKVCV